MNEKEDDITHIDEEKYNTLKDKIIKIIEENYLKDFYKEVKKFQIIAAGYNNSEQKDLRVFNKYGWNAYLIPGAENIYSAYTFERNMLPKMLCRFNVIYDDKTDIFKSEIFEGYGYIVIPVNEKDILYNLISQIDIAIGFYHYDEFNNDSLKYIIRHRIDGYYLDVLVKIK